MSIVFRILTLVLCVELIVAPVNSELSLLGQQAFADTSCPKGLSYDSILNRCLTTAETANVMNATASCNGDAECYKQNAQQAFQNKVNAGEAPERKGNNQFVSTVANVAAIAAPMSIFALGVSSSLSGCASASFWSMVGGSAALVVGDNLANFQHKSRLKKIREDWGKIVNPDDAAGDKDKIREANTESQSQAFEMLARSEDSLVKAAKMKKNFFMIASIAYAASGILAYAETIEDTTGFGKIKNVCPSASIKLDSKKESLYSYYSRGGDVPQFLNAQSVYNLKHSTSIAAFISNQTESSTAEVDLTEYYSKMAGFLKDVEQEKSNLDVFKSYSLSFLNNLSIFPMAIAQSDVQTNAAKSYKEDDGKSGSILLNAGLGAAAVGAIYLAKNTVKPFLLDSINRALIAGVMSVMSMTMASHAGSQAEASEKRAQLLRKMRDDFVSASGSINACGSEDRSNPDKPSCYCYTADNQRNPNRNASQVCQKLWAGLNQGSPLASLPQTESSKICINNKNQADESCACKANNTCMKVSMGNLKGISPGSLSMLNSAIDPLNKIANGSVDAAKLDAGSLSNQAMKLQTALKNLEKNPATKNLIKDKAKQEAALMAKLNKGAAGLGANNMLGSTSSSGLPSNPGEAAVMLEKELDEKNSQISGSHVSESNGIQSAPTESLEFGLTADQANAQESQIAEVMKENLDYGSNDINQGSKTNIFEVLSNRYQRSGMRRLFDEKGTTKADKAATTDINN